MDFPLFFLDLFGNRLLMAAIAVLHVMVNHPMAVGAYPLVVLMEWWGWRHKDEDWDRVAYKCTFVLFIITTSIGALTGVGIWLTAALIAPFGIGGLLRVFFWAWFTEWIVFVSEVVLVLIYFLAWKRWREGIWKEVHIGVGVILAGCSWLTMMIITAILGFMMGTGSWVKTHTLFSGFFNPLYIPQLAFRTTYAMLLAGLFIWFLLFFFTSKKTEFRNRAVRFVAGWTLLWVPLCVVSSFWYWRRVPEAMKANLDVALVTQRFTQWSEAFAILIGVVAAVMIATALVGLLRPKVIPRVLLLIPFVLGLFTLGYFERAREFIRKPHVIADYMYSNGVTMKELPVFQRDGILRYATYVNEHQVTSENKIQAGHDVFLIACSRCHTSNGMNGVVRKFELLYGKKPLDENVMVAFIQTMHNTRTYMPPFPGNDKEAGALAAYIGELQRTGEWWMPGAQGSGVPRLPMQPAGMAGQ
jgi:mono/diheme cytochrome c family protein